MATLKQLVDKTTNIKNELKTCHANLKANLIDKGVEVQNDAKIGDLIGNVKNIQTVRGIVKGEGIIYKKDEIETFTSNKKTPYIEYTMRSHGIITASYLGWSNISNTTYADIIVERNGVTIFTKTLDTSSANESYPGRASVVIADVVEGDVVKFLFAKHEWADWYKVKECRIKGDYVV